MNTIIVHAGIVADLDPNSEGVWEYRFHHGDANWRSFNDPINIIDTPIKRVRELMASIMEDEAEYRLSFLGARSRKDKLEITHLEASLTELSLERQRAENLQRRGLATV